MMGVSRAGYYKWKNRKPSDRDINREKMVELVQTGDCLRHDSIQGLVYVHRSDLLLRCVHKRDIEL